MIPSKDDNSNGLHRRYLITKLDGSPVDTDAEYFVLRLDDGGGDHIHIAACRRALIRYAEEIAPHLPELASDIYRRARTWKLPPRPFPVHSDTKEI